MFFLAACDKSDNPGQPLEALLIVVVALGIYLALGYALFARRPEHRGRVVLAAVVGLILAPTVGGIGIAAGAAATLAGIILVVVLSPRGGELRTFLGGVFGVLGWAFIGALFAAALIGGGGCPLD